MVVARIILAALLSFSVAMVPAVGSAAIMSQSIQASVSDGGGMPCDNAAGDCKNFAGCALKCFNFTGAIVSALVLLPCPSGTELSFVEWALRPHISSPPTRPPPV